MSDLDPAERVAGLRGEVDRGPEPPTQFIAEAIGAAVAEALIDGSFGEHLASRGWVLVHRGDGQCPEPPPDFLHDALDLMEPGWIDPLGRAAELWSSAWQAGHRVGRAAAGDSRP